MNQRIGIIYCAYGTEDYVPKSLAPWIDLRAQGNVLICALNLRFAGFEGKDDKTHDMLWACRVRKDIDHLIDGPDNIPETTARGMALTWLKQQGVDLVIQWDSDEMTDVASIQRTLAFIDANPFTTWFRFSYRNLVFDDKTWLADPFTPPRAHRIRAGTEAGCYTAHSFSADNDICYGHHIFRDLHFQRDYPSMTIPAAVFNPKHYTWLNDERSKRKIDYQLRGRGWPSCQFAWDDAQGGLIFNPALPHPKVVREGD